MRRLRSTGALPLAAALALSGLTVSSPVEAVEATSRAGRALLDAASMEPVEVALAARATALTSEERGSIPPAPADNRIVFRVPAAYLAGISSQSGGPHDRGAPGASELTFLFWSRSLDPVRPDELADLAACRPGEARPCAAHGPDGGRTAARRRGGAAASTRCACR